MRQGWGGRPVRIEQAQGILAAASGGAGGALPVWERLMVHRMVFGASPAGEVTPCDTETGTKL